MSRANSKFLSVLTCDFVLPALILNPSVLCVKYCRVDKTPVAVLSYAVSLSAKL